MANKMIIDASHPEETRVVVLRGNRVEDFDFESASKRQLRGNIYLAKVTRVEPSLQAAFIEYGGNRHGFLAFSEIHPDYYQIPVADRQALLEDEARRHAEEDDDEQTQKQRRSRRNRDGRSERAPKRQTSNGDSIAEVPQDDGGSQKARDDEMDAAWSDHAEQEAEAREYHATLQNEPADGGESHHPDRSGSHAGQHGEDAEAAAAPGSFGHIEEVPDEQGGSDEITTLGGEEDADDDQRDDDDGDENEGDERIERAPTDDVDVNDAASGDDRRPSGEHRNEEDDEQEAPSYRAPRHRRQYKIQEVIKRRQVLLVQVVKEERGNKGAALTTYLSLAGRYSVLMPNTARGGGISRKITNNVDRKRLKEIAQELEVPDGMGIILRTAGAARGKAEVKRDFEYLLRMWEQVRELTLKSSAPMLTYEEGSLIKRAIRDLYSKEIDEVIVAGEAGYREAKDFMRMLMPGHSKNVIAYRDPQPIFARAGVDSQLDAMFAAQVTLKSGGYIVINQTEALVAIDVNSGRSTREHNIEDTALRTNLEAADEIARQLRLRDLAGLIVIDFIDMEEHRNNRSVERRIKDALRNDRARIQIGRISHFGLLEMSRQRIRTGVLEGSTVMCAHCMGAGTVRSTASIALHVLRVVEDTLTRSAAYNLTVRSRSTVALYILNQKRSHLRELERRFGVTISIDPDDTLTGVAYHAIERGDPATPVEETHQIAANFVEEYEPEDEIVEETEELEDAAEDTDGDLQQEEDTTERAERGPRQARSQDQGDDSEESQAEKGRRRRRRRRGGRNGEREATDIAANAPQPPDDALGAISELTGSPVAGTGEDAAAAVDEASGAEPRQRNRRSRGGRGRSRNPREMVEAANGSGQQDSGHEASGHEASGQESEGEEHAARQDTGNVLSAAVAGEITAAPAVRAPKAVFWPPAAAVLGPVTPLEVPVEPETPVAAPHVELHPAAAGASPAPAALAAAAAEKPAPVSTELDPAQPKKSGWWKRAATSLGS